MNDDQAETIGLRCASELLMVLLHTGKYKLPAQNNITKTNAHQIPMKTHRLMCHFAQPSVRNFLSALDCR